MVKGRNRQNDMLFDLVFALVSFLSGGGFAVSVVGCMGFEHLSRLWGGQQ